MGPGHGGLGWWEEGKCCPYPAVVLVFVTQTYKSGRSHSKFPLVVSMVVTMV